jgi:hypothetical protein
MSGDGPSGATTGRTRAATDPSGAVALARIGRGPSTRGPVSPPGSSVQARARPSDRPAPTVRPSGGRGLPGRVARAPGGHRLATLARVVKARGDPRRRTKARDPRALSARPLATPFRVTRARSARLPAALAPVARVRGVLSRPAGSRTRPAGSRTRPVRGAIHRARVARRQAGRAARPITGPGDSRDGRPRRDSSPAA